MLKNLKKLRAEYGISQNTLAEHIGVSQQSINKYENSKIEPDIYTMIRIAEFFDTSVDYLIGHSDIRRKIESTHPFELNDEESILITGYRKLTNKKKTAINAVIESYNE